MFHSKAPRRALTRLAASLIILLGPSPLAGGSTPDTAAAEPSVSPARRLADRLEPELRALVVEALERNPRLRSLEAEARAAAAAAPQAKALPYATLAMTAYPAPPETRVGPQRFMASYSQRLPATGKRGLREQAALQKAAALTAHVEARRLALVTRLRRLTHELGFLDRHEAILHELRQHLLQHEEVARARYATGLGLGQAVIKIQADITGVDNQLLGLEQRRVAIREEINALRDRPPAVPLPRFELDPVDHRDRDLEGLAQTAMTVRPELAAANAEIAWADSFTELADKESKPDWTVGVTYTYVDRRSDPAGIANPPPDDGDDILGLQGGVVLPFNGARVEGMREEAFARRDAAWLARRSVETEIRGDVGDLALRLPLQWNQLRLVEDLLVVQAEESLQSAQAAYVAGRLNALDLLDAEHVLFETETAIARAATDYAIRLADLEGEVGQPLEQRPGKE
ncbi:MAG: TolC family protein [Thermoanaerobaculia bacterium]|nr:TolC family protein [Thermoanaerobaculia bacterium]